MSKGPDENDRLRAGTLPKDPSEGTERMTPPGYKKPERGPIRLDERRSPSAKFNIQAEKALLGALLWAGANQPDALRIRQVLDILETGEAFHGQGYGDVFDAMKECAQHGEHDPVAVNTELARRGGGIGFDDLVALKLEEMCIRDSMSDRPNRAPEIRHALTDVRRVCDALGLTADGGKTVVKQARGLIVRCVWHQENTPSMSVRLMPDGTIGAKCFGCDRGGDVLALIAGARGLSLTGPGFRDVLVEGARLGGLWQVVDELEGRGDAPAPRPIARTQPALSLIHI